VAGGDEPAGHGLAHMAKAQESDAQIHPPSRGASMQIAAHPAKPGHGRHAAGGRALYVAYRAR
jgi:hypothetical protein